MTAPMVLDGAMHGRAFLKKHAPRTVPELWDTIARGIDAISPGECTNYFAAAGYDRE